MQCHAKSKRSGKQCKNWAVKGKKVCRMHGARAGIKTAEGRKNQVVAVTKHGFYSKAAVERRRELSHHIRGARNLLNQVRGKCRCL